MFDFNLTLHHPSLCFKQKINFGFRKLATANWLSAGIKMKIRKNTSYWILVFRTNNKKTALIL